MKTAKYKINGKNGLVLESTKEQAIVNCIKIIVTNADNEEEDAVISDQIIKLKQETGVTNDQITSLVGTVRGVRNRVKKRINLFLSGGFSNSDETTTKTNSDINLDVPDDFVPKESKTEKVIIYISSLGIIRKTKSDCLFVKKAFRNLMLKTEEKDIVVQQYKKEYNEKFKGLVPPQVVINGELIGGAAEIDKLIETGEIHKLTGNIEKISYNENPCANCAGHSYFNCPKCLGTGRSRVTRLGLSRELNYLSCTMCDQGLIRCMDCLDLIN